MTRAQVLVLLLFLAVVGAGAAILGPRLARRAPGRATPVAPDAPDDAPPASRPPPEEDLLVVAVVGPQGPLPADRVRLFGADLVRSGEGGTLHLRGGRGPAWVGAEGLAWARVPAGARASAPARVALLPAAEPLLVRVVEADGTPAAGVLLGASPWGDDAGALRTGADGTARLEGRPPGVATLRVGGPERAGPLLRVTLGAATEVTATLDPPRVVTGRVRRGDGTPVAAASVRGLAFEGPVGAETSTGPDGAFRWTGPMTAALAIVVRAEGLAETSVEAPWPDARSGGLASEVDVTLEPAAPAIEGRVRAPAGRRVELSVEPAVAEVLRELYGSDATLGVARAVPVEDDGRFAVGGFARGVPVRLSVRGEVAPEDHVLRPGVSAPLDLRLEARDQAPAAPAGPAALDGVVTDVEGRPLRDVSLVAEGRTTSSDVDGRFRLAGLDAGPRRVEVRYGWVDGARGEGVDPGAFVAGGVAHPRLGEGPVALVLPRRAAVSFRLLDGIDDRPLSWAHVVIVDGDGGTRFDDVVATRDGSVTLEGLDPGTAGVLSAFVPGRRRTGSVSLVAGTTVDLGDLRLAPGARATGAVTGRDGSPVAGAVIAEVEDAWVEQSSDDLARRRERDYRATRAAADGTFVLDGLDAARPTALAIWAPGWAPVPRRIVWSSEEATVRASLSAQAALRLRITDPERRPVSGAAIDLEDPSTGVHLLDLWRRALFGGVVGSTEELRRASESYLAEDPARPGSYRVGPVEPGPYEAWVERPGYVPLRRRLTVADARSQIADLEVSLPLVPEGAAEAPR